MYDPHSLRPMKDIVGFTGSRRWSKSPAFASARIGVPRTTQYWRMILTRKTVKRLTFDRMIDFLIGVWCWLSSESPALRVCSGPCWVSPNMA